MLELLPGDLGDLGVNGDTGEWDDDLQDGELGSRGDMYPMKIGDLLGESAPDFDFKEATDDL